jgi:hypothetical protein
MIDQLEILSRSQVQFIIAIDYCLAQALILVTPLPPGFIRHIEHRPPLPNPY